MIQTESFCTPKHFFFFFLRRKKKKKNDKIKKKKGRKEKKKMKQNLSNSKDNFSDFQYFVFLSEFDIDYGINLKYCLPEITHIKKE